MHQRRNSNLLKVYIKTIVKTIFQPLSPALSMSQWMALIRVSSHSTSKHLTSDHHPNKTSSHWSKQSVILWLYIFFGTHWQKKYFCTGLPLLVRCPISIFEQCLSNIHIWAIFVQYQYLSTRVKVNCDQDLVFSKILLSKLVGALCALFESDNVLFDKRKMSVLYQMRTKPWDWFASSHQYVLQGARDCIKANTKGLPKRAQCPCDWNYYSSWLADVPKCPLYQVSNCP